MNLPTWRRPFSNRACLVAFPFPCCGASCADSVGFLPHHRRDVNMTFLKSCSQSKRCITPKENLWCQNKLLKKAQASVSLNYSWFSDVDLLTSLSPSAPFQIKGGREGVTRSSWPPAVTLLRRYPPNPARHAACLSALSSSCRPLKTHLLRCVAASAATARSLCHTAILSSKSTTWAQRRFSLWTESRPRMLSATC